MTTGDKVLALLGAKAACCLLLVLGGTGALGGAFAWIVDRSIGWLLGAVLVVGIAAILWRSGTARCSPTKAAEAGGTALPTCSAASGERPNPV